MYQNIWLCLALHDLESYLCSKSGKVNKTLLQKTYLDLVRLASIKAPVGQMMSLAIPWTLRSYRPAGLHVVYWHHQRSGGERSGSRQWWDPVSRCSGIWMSAERQRGCSLWATSPSCRHTHTYASADRTQEHLRRGAYIWERRGQVFWRTYTWEQTFAWRGNICVLRQY